MLSKAAYYMQDHIRRNYALISEIAKPTVIMARGRQPFPQGLHAIAKIFTGRLPAHVYAHRYFMERQSDPSQPSPQLHITEESQGILKVMGGMRYMRDNSSKLDSTVVLMTDYSVTVKGRMLCVHKDDLKARQRAMGPLGNSSSVQTRDEEVEMEEEEKKTHCAVGSRRPSGTLVSRERPRASGGSGGLGKGIGVGSGGFQGMLQASHGSHLGGAATGPPVFPSPEDEMDECGGEEVGAAEGSARSTLHGGSMVDRRRSYHFFHVALYPRSAPSSLYGGKSPSTQAQAEKKTIESPTTKSEAEKKEEEEGSFQPVFQEKEGGYTVLYNPVEVSDKTFADLIHKLHDEERVVGAIVLPTRHAWRHVQLWADAFPDAVILSSGPVPVEEAESPALPHHSGVPLDGDGPTGPSPPPPPRAEAMSFPSPSPAVTGGCRDMGGGVMGLSFPEVEEEEVVVESGSAKKEKEGSPSAPLDGASSSPPPAFPGLESASVAFTSSLGHRADEDALLDAILRHPGEMYLKPFVGLRKEDAARVMRLRSRDRDSHAPSMGQITLPEALKQKDASEARTLQADALSSVQYLSQDEIHLTPSLQLHFIHGDPNAEEFVLYDAHTQTLACTELFHGEYSDLDPVNSWMARVWFKFMKRGNHKRVDVVPRDKWLGIRDGNKDPQKGPVASVALVRQSIDRLTKKLPIQLLVYAHGTPPLAQDPARMLRRQWGMSE